MANKEESEKKPLPEAFRILAKEEEIFKERLEAIRRVSSTQSKDLRKKALEVFALMDEWIGTRYKAEIECAKDLVLLIKDAIEKQRRLPNLIYVENEKLMLDYSTLVYKPEDPPRPDSPVEKNCIFRI
jgi:hypothetical protein